jgi:hypothetical protein
MQSAPAPRLSLDIPNTTLPVALLLRELPITRRPKLVDIGANPWAEDAVYKPLLDLGACDVLGFDPQLSDAPSTDRASVLPYALGDGSPRVLRIYQDRSKSSFLPVHAAGQAAVAMRPWADMTDEISFDTKRMDDIAAIGEIDLLKIGVQGGEGAVLAHAAQTLRHATVIIADLRHYRLYEGEAMMGGLDTALRAMGFGLHKFLTQTARSLRHSQSARLKHRYFRDQLIEGEAVYLRDLALVDQFSDAQLMHLAILASAVLQSHSLVLFCLDHLAARGVVGADLPVHYVDALPAQMRMEGDQPQGKK